MCVYCQKLFTGNSCEYMNHAKIEVNGAKIFDLITSLSTDDYERPVLQTIMLSEYGMTISKTDILVAFCPSCGRELRQD